MERGLLLWLLVVQPRGQVLQVRRWAALQVLQAMLWGHCCSSCSSKLLARLQLELTVQPSSQPRR